MFSPLPEPLATEKRHFLKYEWIEKVFCSTIKIEKIKINYKTNRVVSFYLFPSFPFSLSSLHGHLQDNKKKEKQTGKPKTNCILALSLNCMATKTLKQEKKSRDARCSTTTSSPEYSFLPISLYLALLHRSL